MMVSNGKWHVDRGLPVAGLVAASVYVLAQMFTFGYYAASTNARLSSVELAQTNAAALAQASQSALQLQNDRLTRMEERVTAIGNGVSRIEARLAEGAPVRR